MEREHTPTIIRLILSMDLVLIELKDSHKILHFFQHLSFLFFSFNKPEQVLAIPANCELNNVKVDRLF